MIYYVKGRNEGGRVQFLRMFCFFEIILGMFNSSRTSSCRIRNNAANIIFVYGDVESQNSV